MKVHQTNVMLSRDETAWLDAQRLAIRAQSGAAVNRSAFIRAIIRAVQAMDFDFSLCRSEKDIAGVLGFLIGSFRDRAIASPAFPPSPTEPLGTQANEGGCVQAMPGAPRRVRRFGLPK
jgi:hypothetical protein